MKNLIKTTLLLLSISVLASLSVSANAQQQDAEKLLEAFPVAEKGMVRHVIQVKKRANESFYKIEIVPGKNMVVDCNLHTLMGKLEEKDLQGWGYTYYVFSSNGQTRSTMMACNKPDENKFVQAQTLTVRYNSKLPIVIYAPEGYDIKYKIWKTNKQLKESVLK